MSIQSIRSSYQTQMSPVRSDLGTHCREGEAGHNVSLKGNMGKTSRLQTVSTKLQWIAEQAIRYPEMVFTTLAHHIDMEFLREAYKLIRKDAAPGIDRVTAKGYASNLDENLVELHALVKGGCYNAPPVYRVWIPKDDGGERPLGVPTFEDK